MAFFSYHGKYFDKVWAGKFSSVLVSGKVKDRDFDLQPDLDLIPNISKKIFKITLRSTPW